MAEKKKEANKRELNMTYTLDIVFLLIIFFLLVTNFTTQELPELEVPKPDISQAYELETERIVINVIPSDEGEGTTAKEIIVDGKIIPAGQEGILTDMLKKSVDARGGDASKMEVDVRAGATLAYDQVAPVMKAVTGASIARINLVAHQEE